VFDQLLRVRVVDGRGVAHYARRFESVTALRSSEGDIVNREASLNEPATFCAMYHLGHSKRVLVHDAMESAGASGRVDMPVLSRVGLEAIRRGEGVCSSDGKPGDVSCPSRGAGRWRDC
jgi:hypothetical protein